MNTYVTSDIDYNYGAFLDKWKDFIEESPGFEELYFNDPIFHAIVQCYLKGSITKEDALRKAVISFSAQAKIYKAKCYELISESNDNRGST